MEGCSRHTHVPRPISLINTPQKTKQDWKTHGSTEIASVKVKLTPVFNEAAVSFPVPAKAENGPDGVYFVAFIDGVNVEDRVYETKLKAPGA